MEERESESGRKREGGRERGEWKRGRVREEEREREREGGRERGREIVIVYSISLELPDTLA